MVAESWFRSLWKTSRKHEISTEKMQIGVLAFEVASLMSKLVHLWQSLSDKQVAKLREEIANSVGIHKLVSEDDDYIVRLICAEMTENLGNVASAIARLAKRCSDTLLKSFEQAYGELIKIGVDPYGWQLSWKKMDRKVKKMERFILINANLYQEMETLGDLEQTVRRMKANDNSDVITLVEYEKKVAWKQQEVKHLKQISLWNRSYDYIILLLARSLFTIFSRIGHVFGINNVVRMGVKDSKDMDSDYIRRSHSVAFTQSSVHPSENGNARFSSGPLGNVTNRSGLTSNTKNMNFYSGPLGSSVTTSSSTSAGRNPVGFFSGPIARSTATSGPLPKTNRSGLRLWQFRHHSSKLEGKNSYSKNSQMTPVGPLKGCMMGGNIAPVKHCHVNTLDAYAGTVGSIKNANQELLASSNSLHGNLKIFSSKNKLLNAPPDTLGAAALALHYANVIIVIEKLVASPHLIGHDARDDLYNMLPASIRAALRERLKPYAKSFTSSIYDTVLAEEWNEAISGILEWLAPLAHNMIRWQSERSFEQQNLVSRTNVLLVQTLYFANQEKIESAITELLVGLNYIWRFGREINAKALVECNSARTFDSYLDE